MYEQLREKFIQTDTPYKEGAVDVFEQVIPVTKARKATLIITALGIYEAELNGEKVGDILFAPGYTYYPRQLQVQTYDVTGQLCAGENILRVCLGQGWYCGRYTFDNKCQIYGEHAAVSWMLTVEEDGGNAEEQGLAVYTSTDSTVTVRESPYEYA